MSFLLSQETATGLISYGALYLSGMVGSSICIVWSIHRQQQGKNSNNDRLKTHYQQRQEHFTYWPLTPLACVSLFVGLILNLFVHPLILVAVAQFVVAFGTAFNNGNNVVNPGKELLQKKKDDENDDGTDDDDDKNKKTTTTDAATDENDNSNSTTTKQNKENEDDQQQRLLQQISRGHQLDLVGFAILLFLQFYPSNPF